MDKLDEVENTRMATMVAAAAGTAEGKSTATAEVPSEEASKSSKSQHHHQQQHQQLQATSAAMATTKWQPLAGTNAEGSRNKQHQQPQKATSNRDKQPTAAAARSSESDQ